MSSCILSKNKIDSLGFTSMWPSSCSAGFAGGDEEEERASVLSQSLLVGRGSHGGFAPRQLGVLESDGFVLDLAARDVKVRGRNMSDEWPHARCVSSRRGNQRRPRDS